MLKETLTYDDFNEVEQTKDFYFNLSRAEFALVELKYRGGIEGHLKEVIDEGNGRKIMDFFGSVIDDSYGVRSGDGTEFIKSEENLRRFRGSGAYDAMLEKVLDDPNYALTFIRGILPGKYQEAIKKREEEQAQAGFRPGAQTLPQSEIDKRAAEAATPESYSAPAPVEPVQVPVEDALPTDALLEGEPGYAQGLTRRQARELGLL